MGERGGWTVVVLAVPLAVLVVLGLVFPASVWMLIDGSVAVLAR
jgi:hypothetical protein